MKRLLASIGMLVIFPLLSPAQTERGAIRGTVLDSTGSVVPHASVTAINVATGVRTETSSTEAGNYQVPYLPAGDYRVEVEKAGFKKLVRENVRVEVAGTEPYAGCRGGQRKRYRIRSRAAIEE